MVARRKNRGLTYFRRSSGRQETSLETQLEWSQAAATQHQVPLNASLDDLQVMKERRLIAHKDICLDDSITGADLNRPGFRALIDEALRNKDISHIFIHKRDRFARPEDAIEMVAIEKRLLLAGITIVYSDGVAEPMERGRQYPERELAMLLGYYESGAFLLKLAERVLDKQRLLALEGFRTGGNAPHGFVRVLVDSQGRILEELAPGRRVRQAGCHVRAMPKDGRELTVRLLILELKQQGWGFKRIATHLNQMGIPSPDAGKTRTDHGIPHLVSGTWSASTVREICLDPLNVALQEYGRRSEGAHRRCGAEGPRLLGEGDRNAQDQPRTILNNSSVTITRPTGMKPLVEAEHYQELRRQIEERGKNQRGIPRTRDPARYPLSCRVVDLTDGCGAMMYGRRHGQRPLYVCGRYMRTEGAECHNNTVDGEALLRFVLKTLRQLVERQGARDKLRQLLLKRARQQDGGMPASRLEQEIQLLQGKVRELQEQKATVGRRMALETDDDRYQAIAQEFDRLKVELARAEKELEGKQRDCPTPRVHSVETEVESAMAVLDDICRIASNEQARREVNPMLRRLGLWIGLTFGSAIKGQKREVRRLLSGRVTFGDGRLPVPVYGADNRQDPRSSGGAAGTCPEGAPREDLPPSRPTRTTSAARDRKHKKDRGDARGAASAADPGPGDPESAQPAEERCARVNSSQPESISFTKGNRGDRRLTFPNDPTGSRLLWLVLPQPLVFTADSFLSFGSAS